MKKVKVYIAVSIDGYIADKNGSVNWIAGDSDDKSSTESYDKFYSSIDTVLIGHKTYMQIKEELSVDSWPYEDKTSYIITNYKENDTHNIKFSSDLINTVQSLVKEKGNDIWVCGGASIINQLLKSNMVDNICLTIVPVMLGSGIRLFENFESKIRLKLISTISYNGFVENYYDVIN